MARPDRVDCKIHRPSHRSQAREHALFFKTALIPQPQWAKLSPPHRV